MVAAHFIENIMKTNPFAFFVHQLETHLPAPLRPIQAEMKANAKRILTDKLDDFDLVSREKWQAQQQALEQAEARIHDLEARLAALESQALPATSQQHPN